ncbi:MAG: DUF72 domain-containing protein [Gammaproteobacteria bacterium]
MLPEAYIGTSGWSYEGWRSGFYAGVPRKNWLEYCAANFTGIEVNGTFYRLQSAETFVRWREETPPGFRFAVKANRFLTHRKRLINPADSIARERERALHLGDKLAAMLWQLPGKFEKNMVRLAGFAEALDAWRDTRHCIEFRHPSWFDAEVAACLEQYRIAACQSDAADWPLWTAVTTDMVYLRLNGRPRTYASSYTASELKAWAEKLDSWRNEGREVHVYFNNDALGAAPYNAVQLLKFVNGIRCG